MNLPFLRYKHLHFSAALTLPVSGSVLRCHARVMARGVLTLITIFLALHDATVRAMPAPGSKPELSRISPRDGETLYTPNPHFAWKRPENAQMEDRCVIQIANDPHFNNPLREDSVDVVSRYVCAEPLAPGAYYWRVRVDGEAWPSQAGSFTVADAKLYEIPAGASQEEIKKVIETAATNGPARVLFPPGRHLISKTINLRRAKDLIIDGGGSTLVIAELAFQIGFSKNVTLQNMTVEPETDPSTHVDIVAVDPTGKTVVVKAKPGFPQDVARYFTPGSGASVMRCVDQASPGKAIRYASLSAQDAAAAITGPNEMGQYIFHQVKDTALKAIRPGMTAYVIRYAHSLVASSFTENLTLCGVTFLGTGGGLRGVDCSAMSYLGCKFLPLTPDHYTGAQGFIGSGLKGYWVENCEFRFAVDDNMAVQSLKLSLDGIDANGIAMLKDHPWISEIRTGDEVLLWHVASNRTATVAVLEALDKKGQPVPSSELEDRRPKTLRLAKNAADLNQELGRPADTPFKDVLLFRYSPNNEDFVFRKNRVQGGSAGCMFNGVRGLIADNTFTNCRGPAIVAGYHSPNEASGYGSREVLVSGNTITDTGGAGVIIESTANVGGSIVIKNNRITHHRIANGYLNAAVIVGNECDHVTVKDNVFASEIAPALGAWIVSRENKHGVKHDNNQTISPFTAPIYLQK